MVELDPPFNSQHDDSSPFNPRMGGATGSSCKDDKFKQWI
jgi:hypothetical protein